MSIVLLGSTSGSCTLQEQAVAGTSVLTLPVGTGTVVANNVNGAIVSGTAVTAATGSPTFIDFLNIPSWVKRITVMLNGVSLSNTDSLIIQIGTGGTPTTSGYTGSSSRLQASTISSNAYSGSGFQTIFVGIAANLTTGNLVITNITSNTWICTGSLAGTVTNLQTMTSGSVSIAGVLNMVRITSDGTATFDAGTINILYE
jgi:hypothetical protein